MRCFSLSSLVMFAALATLASLPLATPLAAQGAGDGAVRDTNVVLKPGDMVKVSVWRNQEMSGDFVVGVNGALRHPLYQQVPIAGVPLSEVEARLRKFLSQYEQNPQLVVEPLFRVMVGGEVRQPNLLSVPRSTTVGEAVALAGGPTTEGRLDKVKLIRGNKEYKIDLTNPDATWARMPVRSGDAILIGRRSHFFSQVVLPLVGVAGSVASIITLTRRY